MPSHYCIAGTKNLGIRRHRGGAVALEFAILAIPFFLWILFIFEMSYDLFTQEALDYTLNAAVRQIQTGNAVSQTSGSAFIQNDLCAAAKGLLECNQMWVQVQALPAGTDYSNPSVTTGAVPGNGNLDLSDYTNLAGANTGGTNPNAPIPYCIAGASQAILVSAIYIGPSFISGLLPGVLSTSFGFNTVHATLSTAGFVTEPFQEIPNNPPNPGSGTPPSAPACT